MKVFKDCAGVESCEFSSQECEDKDYIVYSVTGDRGYNNIKEYVNQCLWEVQDDAELARLLAPAGEIVNGWFLGYEEDSDHAIDIEPEHIAALVCNWTRLEDEEAEL